MTADGEQRIAVLASGGGTNCQALLDACASGALEAQIVAVVTNVADAGVVDRATQAEVPVVVVEHRGQSAADRQRSDARLIAELARFQPDVVVLAGWMRILGPEVGARFPIINLHPAKPGEFAGIRAIERAYEAWQRGEIDESGVMVHWVPDEGVDVGPLIVTEAVPFVAGDSLEKFAERLHEVEHRLIVAGTAIALRTVSSTATRTP